MYSQQTDISNFKNMECCPNNYFDNTSNQSWSVNQNDLMVKSEIWPPSTPNQNYAENFYASTQNNTYYAPSQQNYNTNGNPVVSDSFRKQASVADWEAYLLSPLNNTGNHITQNPNNIVNTEAARNTGKLVTQKSNHRAHITFVHTSAGIFKPIVKRKRKRTSFTTEQVEALETIFFKRPYVSREERQVLTEKLQVSDKAIKVWFQNRRLKVKKEKEEQEMESSDSETLDVQESKPLAYVESQIYNADEFGYVTLDDRAINEIVNVIDQCLPKDADLGDTNSDISESEKRLYSVSESESSAMYEPISPPDLSDNASQDNFAQNWEAFEAIEPRKSLQNLLDVHMYKDANLSVF